MGKIIINNYSKIRDEQAVRTAYQILAECSETLICQTADAYHVDVGVRTDDETGEKTFTVTDRDLKEKIMLDMESWSGTDEELLDTMDEAIGNFMIALAEDGISFSDERDVRRLFLEAFSRHDIQERILLTAIDLLAEDKKTAMGGI